MPYRLCTNVITRTVAAGTAQTRAARKKHACIAATQAAEWLRRMMTKPCLLLGRSQTTGLGAPCATFVITSVKHSAGNIYVADVCRRLGAKEHTLGTPAARIASNKRQPPPKDVEAITAYVTWPKPLATSPTPIRRYLVLSAPLLTCLPYLKD